MSLQLLVAVALVVAVAAVAAGATGPWRPKRVTIEASNRDASSANGLTLGAPEPPPDNVYDFPMTIAPRPSAAPSQPAPRQLIVGAAARGSEREGTHDAALTPVPRVVFDEGTAGLVVAPSIRLRHRVDELVVAAGLPARATTFVVALGDRQDRVDVPRRHGLVAFASNDDAASTFRSWFPVDGGAIPEIDADGQSSLATVVDQVAKAIAVDAARAGPVVPHGQILPRATSHLTGLARVLATDLASGGLFDVDHGLCDAVACVGVVVPVIDGDGRGAVQMVLVAVAEHLSQGASVVRDLAVTAVHEVLVDLWRDAPRASLPQERVGNG